MTFRNVFESFWIEQRDEKLGLWKKSARHGILKKREIDFKRKIDIGSKLRIQKTGTARFSNGFLNEAINLKSLIEQNYFGIQVFKCPVLRTHLKTEPRMISDRCWMVAWMSPVNQVFHTTVTVIINANLVNLVYSQVTRWLSCQR